MPAERILIVEDEQVIRQFMKSNLEQMGYQVPADVSTGEEALHAAGEFKPDVVLMDIELQGTMDGIEAARLIRLEFGIPAIFVTADQSDDTMERTQLAEPLGFIPKPFTVKSLQGAIETGLHSYRAVNSRTRKAIQFVENQYRNLFENMIQGIFRITSSGRLVLANASFAKFLGYSSPEELVEFVPDIERHFASSDRYNALLEALKKNNYVEDFEFQACRKDGSKIWLAQNTRSLRDSEQNELYYEGIVQDISERKRTEDMLRASMSRQAATLAAVPDIIMEVDVNRIYKWANKAGFEFFGNDVIGKEAAHYFEGDQNTYDSVNPIFGGEEKLVYIESWQRRKDGQKRLLAWQCHVLKDYRGMAVGAISSARDITDSKLAEQERLKSLTRQVLLNQLQRELLGAGELDCKLKIITQGMVDIFEADFCRIWLTGRGDLCELGCVHATVREGPHACMHKEKCLRLIASSGRYTHTNGSVHQRIPFGAYKVGRIASGEEHQLFTNDVASDPAISDHDWAKKLGLSSFAGFQLRSSDGESFGVLALFSSHTIAPEEQAQMDALSGSTAQLILRAQADEALRQSEERFRLIAETIDEVFWMTDIENKKMLYISPAFDRIWGYSRQAMYENRNAFQEMLHPEDADWVIEELKIQKSGQPYSQEYRIVRPDGSVRQIWDQGFPVIDELGRIRNYVGVSQDVTDWRNAETRLKKSTDYLNQLLNCIGDPIFVKDRRHRFVFSNDANCTFIGLPREELIGNSLEDHLEKDSVNLIIEQEERVFRTGASDITTEEFQTRYGRRYTVMAHKTLLTDADGNQQLVGVVRDITDRKRFEDELRESEARLSSVVNAAQDGIIMLGEDGLITLFSPAAERITGYAADEIIGKALHLILVSPTLHPVFAAAFPTWRQTGSGNAIGRTLEVPCVRKDKTEISIELSLSSLQWKGHWMAVGIIRDITERKRVQAEREGMEIQLRQAQKLEAIGQLAAGIAHEINTPTQYVGDNTRFLKDAFDELKKVMENYNRLLKANREENVNSKLLDEIETAVAEADLDYLTEETPKAISQSLEGLNRITTIVRAMKEFSHPGGEEKQAIDLNHAIENTLTVCRNEWKYVAEIALELDPMLPLVPCLPGDVNQVILNLVVNAAHAIAESANIGEKGKGLIGVATRHDENWAEIRISDTGIGIPEKNRSKIFTPFFTTKGVGKGTGQGLAISHSVIVGKHNGTLEFETEAGKGTTFIIRLPLLNSALKPGNAATVVQ
jgi:two-component system, NtrC family, sensor kinase